MNPKLLLLLASAATLFNTDLLKAQVVEDGTLSTEVTQESDRTKKLTMIQGWVTDAKGNVILTDRL